LAFAGKERGFSERQQNFGQGAIPLGLSTAAGEGAFGSIVGIGAAWGGVGTSVTRQVRDHRGRVGTLFDGNCLAGDFCNGIWDISLIIRRMYLQRLVRVGPLEI
jgi:hypothetical protein